MVVQVVRKLWLWRVQMHSFLRVRILSAVDHLTIRTVISLRKRLFDLHQCTLLPLSIRSHRLNWDMRLPVKVLRVSYSYQEIAIMWHGYVVSHLLQINQAGVWYEIYSTLCAKVSNLFETEETNGTMPKKPLKSYLYIFINYLVCC